MVLILLATVVCGTPVIAQDPGPPHDPVQLDPGGWCPAGWIDKDAVWHCGDGTDPTNSTGTPQACDSKQCPPKDEKGQQVLSCWYEYGLKTGYRCIRICKYSADGSSNWGTQVDNSYCGK